MKRFNLLLYALIMVGCSNTQEIASNSESVFSVDSDSKEIVSSSLSSIEELSSSEVMSSSDDIESSTTSEESLSSSESIFESSTEEIIENEYIFPKMYVNTEYGRTINSKETYINCNVSITDSLFNIANVEAGIRGRGNSTWAWAKKPYRIKFNEKQGLFGYGKAKSWTLIANHCDLSLARNYLALNLSKNTDDIGFTSTATYCSLYLNGSYQGLYLVCDQIQSGKTRININEELNGDPAATGYLLEMDVKDRVVSEGKIEGIDYFTIGTDTSKAYVIKTPDTEDELYNEVYFNFIKSYLEGVNTYLTAKATKENYDILASIIDMNSFADTYIISELFNNCDVGWSMYMYKDANDKLRSGPIWDFDISSGNCAYHPSSCDPTTMWARGGSGWYANLFRFEEFRELVCDKMAIYKDRFAKIIDDEVDNLLLYENEFNKNFEKWKILGVGVNMGTNPISTETMLSFSTWKEQILYLQEWLHESLDAMASEYGK